MTTLECLALAPALAHSPTIRTHGTHVAVVTDPETGAELDRCLVNLGSHPVAARRVTRRVARLWAAGAVVTVETARGREARSVVVARDGLPYLRSWPSTPEARAAVDFRLGPPRLRRQA